MRLLAKRFAVSAFVVFQAVALLERDGQLERQPRRGVLIRATAPTDTRAVRLIIAEVLPWQVAFWRAVVAQAVDHGQQVELVQVTSHAALAGLIADGRPTVIANLTAAFAAELPLLDLGHANNEAFAALRDDLVPLAAAMPTTLLPMVVQVPALITVAGGLSAEPARDWPALAKWLRTAIGPQRMVPPSLTVIAEALGLDHALAAVLSLSAEEVLSAEKVPTAKEVLSAEEVPRLLAVAGELVRAVEALRHAGVLGAPLAEPAVIAAGLRSGALGAVVRSSFVWPGFGLIPGGTLSVYPLPGPQCAATVLGLGCTTAGAAAVPALHDLLMLLTGPHIQRLQLEHALGCSPRRSVLDAAIAQPAGLAPGLAAIAASVRDAAARPVFTPRFTRLMQALTDRALLPLLTGEHDHHAAMTAVAEVVSTCTGRHELLRHLLLTEV